MEKMRTEMQKLGDELQNKTIASISKVLTKSQKAAFNKMLGKPFDLTKLTNPNGPGGPGGPPAATTDAAKSKDDAAKPDTSSKKKTTTRKTRKAAA
jgi:hypothetical protein